MRVLRKLKEKFRRPTEVSHKEYFFGDYKLILKKEHVLEKYQQSFPLYDRFLPILCADFDGLIIDIGANIGDTSIAIFSKNVNSFIVGVEPDVSFYQDCMDNILLNDLTHRFLGINKFVSTNQGSFSLEKSSTMSTGSISSNGHQFGKKNTISFTELMGLIPKEKASRFEIVKIDTDGFDWDILNSFAQYVNNFQMKPRFVFFEMQTYLNNLGVYDENRGQIVTEYLASIKSLVQMGYNNFCLIDNFGTPIKITQSIVEIFDLNDYLTRSQVCNSHSTIYYLDVLAFCDLEIDFVKEVMKNLQKR